MLITVLAVENTMATWKSTKR